MVRLTRCFSRRRWNVILLLALSAILILRLLHQRSEKHQLKSHGEKGPDIPDQNNTSWAERKIDSFKTIMSAFHDDQSSEEEDEILDTTPSSNKTSEEEEFDFFGDEWMGMLDNVLVGGRWAPEAKAGGSSEKIAIVVPYRSRRDHLKMFLFYMHPFLQRQGRHYGIYVVGQRGVEPRFCKGILYNMGFVSVLKDDSYDCIIFHDVDLIPEDDRNEYTCGNTPRHLSVAVNTFNYTLPYEKIFGGVVAMTPSQYRLLNGYSNRFCGWGGEDDDMYNRLVKHKLQVSRPEKDVGRYTMFEHRGTPENKNRFSLLQTSDLRAHKDGLNSVGKTRAKITSMSRQPLFTHIVVSVAKQRRWKH